MTSVSTQMVNGRTTVTRREVRDGIETVTVTENGVTLSCTVNGVPQPVGALEGGGGGEVCGEHVLRYTTV